MILPVTKISNRKHLLAVTSQGSSHVTATDMRTRRRRYRRPQWRHLSNGARLIATRAKNCVALSGGGIRWTSGPRAEGKMGVARAGESPTAAYLPLSSQAGPTAVEKFTVLINTPVRAKTNESQPSLQITNIDDRNADPSWVGCYIHRRKNDEIKLKPLKTRQNKRKLFLYILCTRIYLLFCVT